MTEERLAQVREWCDWFDEGILPVDRYDALKEARGMITDLLTEHQHLQIENEQLRKVIDGLLAITGVVLGSKEVSQ